MSRAAPRAQSSSPSPAAPSRPYTKDGRVDAYIDALPDWQQVICRRVRDLAHAADPEVEETIKRTRQPYFVLDGNICALLAAKDQALNEPALAAMFTQIIANNRAGGWRKLKGST